METAVEWLYKNLLDNPISNEDIIYNINVYEKAKEMHKQEIINAYYYEPNCDKIKDDGEQYYNETFKKENNEN
jgi:hypothetical protein